MPVEISGSGPPSPEKAVAILLDEGRKAMVKHGQMVHREVLARMARHRKTGHMMRSVFSRIEMIGTTIQGLIGSPLDYAKFHEFGTGLYGPRNRWIEPTHAQALRWPNMATGAFTLGGRQRSGRAGEGARWIFARRVRGIKPLRYFRDAHAVTEPRALPVFRHHADEAARRLAEAWD